MVFVTIEFIYKVFGKVIYFKMATINDSILLELRTTNPSTPEEGEMYYNSSDKKLKIYNGTDWVNL